MPKISIVLPTYNRAHTIGRAIDSIFTQNVDNFELIVIDNGSTDDTESIVNGYWDDRIQYHYYKNKKGPGAARNYGISKTTGKYIAFLDSDDEWLPGKLEKQIAVLNKSAEKACLVYTDMWWQSLNGKQLYHRAPEIEAGRILDKEKSFYQVYKVGIQSILLRRELVEKSDCFREDLSCFEDMEFLIRLAIKCQFIRIPEPLVNYYETSGSVSKQYAEELIVRTQLLKIYKKELFKFKMFYIREKLIVTVCKYLELEGYFSNSNNQPFIKWLKKNDSPYVIRFQKTWVRLTNRFLGEYFSRISAGFQAEETIAKADVIIVLAPPNDNRLEKLFDLCASMPVSKLLMFKNSNDQTFGNITNASNKKRVEELSGKRDFQLLSHANDIRPSTLTEIKKLSEILSKESRVIVITDGFHTRRVRMVVNKIFGENADRIHLAAAENRNLQVNNWWHSLSGLRTYRREWIKQKYYQYYLLRRI